MIVCGHLVLLQFVRGKELSEKAYKQQVRNQLISPNRGTIYDSKGEILAQSISVDTISINPGKIKSLNNKAIPNEKVAEGISNIFDVTYDEMMEKLNSNKSVIVVEKKVETDKIKKLKDWMKEENISTGINIDADSKRYYPYNNLASNLIGFCGTDNIGQTGLEQRWNDVLTGTAGKVVTAMDIHGNAISDEDELYIASENGSNIYLTIDSTLQSIAEKYIEQGVKENPTAISGNVIMMNPQTGDILAMATYPDYNLNDPSNFIYTGISQEEWDGFDKTTKSGILLDLWKNKAVSEVYEPGSTFKLITAAVGLEEGIVKTNTENDFLCTGAQVVGVDTEGKDISISCWRAHNPHGPQTLTKALCNSCNPAFMQLGKRIGAKTLYKYYKALNLFEPVGEDIAKSYAGKFHSLEEIGPVELATTSFGQRFTISPLQLVTAVSTICNDGKLVKPKIVKQIENTDTGSVEMVETEIIRQVFSKQTADEVKKMMQAVVLEGTGGKVKIEGYSIGGKSGTSEPQQGNEDHGYVASFIAISPIENTQLVTLVAIHGLQEDVEHQGGAVAGPIARQILLQALPNLGITSSVANQEEVEEDEKLIAIPNVNNLSVNEARNTLEQLGFNVIVDPNVNGAESLVIEQVPKQGATLLEGSIVRLYTSTGEEHIKVQVPNVKGMSKVQAINELRARNLNVKIDGDNGVVSSQEPTYEIEVEEGTIINLVISEELHGAY